jgi:hypothetical protein
MTEHRERKIIGFSGHQTLSTGTQKIVRASLMQILLGEGNILTVTSLAAGSDQIFAECVLASDKRLMVIIPCQHYERTFSDPADLAKYYKLLKSSVNTIQLPFNEPSEEAYWAAGKKIVDVADTLVAVWDGQPAGGLGGTADVVEYARKRNKQVMRIWPSDSSRK